MTPPANPITMAGMYPVMAIDLGGGLRLRTLTGQDADLLVEATSQESGKAMWGPRPVGPYSLGDAAAALRAWDGTSQVSFGLLDGDRLLATVGLMVDGEIGYWVRPDARRRGFGVHAVAATTHWVHDRVGLSRVWLEIDPANTASLRLAHRAGYHYVETIPRHCRVWRVDDAGLDDWHDCAIWHHDVTPTSPGPPVRA